MTDSELGKGSEYFRGKPTIRFRLAAGIPDGVDVNSGPQLLGEEAAMTAFPGAKGVVALFEDRGNVVVAQLNLGCSVTDLAQQVGIEPQQQGANAERLTRACLANGLRNIVLQAPEARRDSAYKTGQGLKLVGYSPEAVVMQGLVMQVRA
jgi:hypothetical protein